MVDVGVSRLGFYIDVCGQCHEIFKDTPNISLEEMSDYIKVNILRKTETEETEIIESYVLNDSVKPEKQKGN